MKLWRVMGIVALLAGLGGCANKKTVADSDSSEPKSPWRALASDDDAKSELISEDLREKYVRKALIMEEADIDAIAERDIESGPNDGDFSLETEISCTYDVKKMGGTTPKFACKMDDGTSLKVKYRGDSGGKVFDQETTLIKKDGKAGEIFAAPVATRLLWALGFATNHAYQIKKVHCKGCPSNPWKVSQKGDTPKPNDVADRTFDGPLVEVKFGKTLESKVDEGWDFKEDLPRTHGASLAEIDALKLLMAFIQHGDNKHENQKLMCRAGQGGRLDCKTPYFVATDVGSTFGKGGSTGPGTKVNFKEWGSEKHTIWKDKEKCVAKLSSLGGTLSDPQISEAGRVYLLARLTNLSHEQITAIFRQGRIHEWDSEYNPKPAPGEKPDVQHWVNAFKRKVADIASAKCPG